MDPIVLRTQSICPKGWTLPSAEQMDNLTGGTDSGSATFVSVFSPGLGGGYHNGSLTNATTRGRWWSSTVSTNNAGRRHLIYEGTALITGANISRYMGIYIRCIQAS